MGILNKDIKKEKFEEFTTTFQVHDFFGGSIPSEWKDAKYTLDINFKKCSMCLYLSALEEQQHP